MRPTPCSQFVHGFFMCVRYYVFMSVLGKDWKVKNSDPHLSLLKKLLANRGLKDETAMEDFFHPTRERNFHDPFLMRDMERAVLRAGKAIEQGQRIMIFGDYDVDGVTATAILMRTLKKLGANVSYRLPHRVDDGYGLREKFVREFKRLDVKLAITVDNGISCFKEVAFASALGIDVIITDHHTIPEKIPEAFAILHPKLPGCGYPFTELTGAGVALKFAQALLQTRMGDCQADIDVMFDFACMGTIADLGALYGENRFIVKEGLKALTNTRWPGLSRLKESAGVRGNISTQDVAFFLSPRLNAAGRLSHPSHALKLLLSGSEDSEPIASHLEQLNRKRQKLMVELMEIAEECASSCNGDPVIMVHHPSFHGGVIGLIAAKLSEQYNRPAIVMEERSGVCIGSCRSTSGINIVEALSDSKDLLNHFGGHAAAAGFEISKENLPEFSRRMCAFLGKNVGAAACVPSLSAECEIAHEDISKKTVEMLEWFAPFGMGNDLPRFICRNLKTEKVETVGKDKKHLKIRAGTDMRSIDCIAFRLGDHAAKLSAAGQFDAVCEIQENSWNGTTNLQLNVIDFEPSRTSPSYSHTEAPVIDL